MKRPDSSHSSSSDSGITEEPPLLPPKSRASTDFSTDKQKEISPAVSPPQSTITTIEPNHSSEKSMISKKSSEKSGSQKRRGRQKIGFERKLIKLSLLSLNMKIKKVYFPVFNHFRHG